MRASRLLSILMLLQVRDRLTAEALAEEFEVSVRTIYRDIDHLAEAGIPVYADRGPGGGFRLLDGYRTRMAMLASDEAQALFMIGLPGPADALGMGEAAARAGRKMLATLPRASGDAAGRLRARFHVDPAAWYHDDAPPVHLPEIARAVLEQRLLAMTYESWRGVREREVAPLGLVLKGGDWYMAARGDDGGIRIYRVANILRHTLREQRFERPEEFDLATWWTAETARFERGLRTDTARLRASAEGCRRLARLGSFAARAVRAAVVDPQSGDDDPRWCVEFPIEGVAHAALQLLGIGAEIEVLAPQVLREHMRMQASAIAARHAD